MGSKPTMALIISILRSDGGIGRHEGLFSVKHKKKSAYNRKVYVEVG